MEGVDGQEATDGDARHGDALAPSVRLTPTLTLPIWRAEDDRTVAVAVDPAVYSMDAILKAAYKFTGDFYAFVTRSSEVPAAVLVVFRPKRGTASPDLAGTFANELVDQQVRCNLDAQFGPLRTMIVAQAFAEGNLLDPARDDGDYLTDPQGAGRRR